jgi:hypothetical protein
MQNLKTEYRRTASTVLAEVLLFAITPDLANRLLDHRGGKRLASPESPDAALFSQRSGAERLRKDDSKRFVHPEFRHIKAILC